MGDSAADHKMEEDTAMGSPAATVEKGKGKATEQPELSMDEDSSEEEESGAENEVPEAEAEDEESMEEINTENIINDGRRTRGKTIDFKKAAAEMDDDDEDDDDEDFHDPDDAMQE